MSTLGRVRGPYAKTADRRREILEAGIDVFSTSGFRSGSIREIAERVGMSQAGLLHHFSNKNELLARVLELRDDLSKIQFPIGVEPGIETLRGFASLVDYNTSVPGLVELHCVLSAEATSPDHPAHQYFVDRYTWTHGITLDAFVALEARGELAPGIDPALAAHSVIALMDGLQVQWLLDRESVDMGAAIRHYLRPLLTIEL